MSFELTASNYYSVEANREYWSASQVKSMLKCPAAAVAEINGEYVRPLTSALLLGSYVDAYFEGTLDEFVLMHPELLKRDGTLKAEYVLANKMIAKAKADPVFMEYMDGEKQHIQTGEIFGLPFKAKFDVYKPGVRVTDLKTVKDFEPVYLPGQGKVNFAEAWNWPLQLAIYQALEGNRLPQYLNAISKQDPPDIAVIEVPQDTLDTEMAVLENHIFLFDAYKKGAIEAPRCGKCPYCRATKKLDAPRPLDDYIYSEEM